jgi:mono/diheme cytochrome c family protein
MEESAMMKRPLRIGSAIAALALLTIGARGARAADDSGAAGGKAILEKHCGRCHSIEATGESPLQQAPPLRQVYLSFPIEELEVGLAEGMGSRHRDMPQIQFSAEQVSAILTYLGSITGLDPSKRPRAPASGETPP